MTNEQFEMLANEFYKETGVMAPGKDISAAAGTTASFDERIALWRKWLSERKDELVAEGRKGTEYFCPHCQKLSASSICDHCKASLEPCNESIVSLFSLIDDKTITAEDFDRFITETSPTSLNKRVQRQLRPGKIGPQVGNPERKVDDKTDHEPADHNDPTSTLRGQGALRRRVKFNKTHPDQFREAIEFLISYKSLPLTECESKLKDVSDPVALYRLITRLSQCSSEFNLNREWLSGLGHLVLNTIG